MKRYEIVPNQLSVGDFIGWQRGGTLDLNPPFQRRSVWRPGSRSYFIDTLARGLPVPLVFIRERVDLSRQAVTREVVDGQQRLRTVFAFVDPSLLHGFNPARDGFTVRREHNPELAGKTFDELDPRIQRDILGYRFSVQTLPAEVEDRDVLQMFARLNATGIRLNSQELRNAAWFGDLKTRVYEMAYSQLERWLRWEVFSEDQISRMLEVELTSDLVVNMMEGVTGKSQRRLDRLYRTGDSGWTEGPETARRFGLVMDAIDDVYGRRIAESSFSRQMHFFSLYVYVYDKLFGLGSSLGRSSPRSLPRSLRTCLDEADRRFKDGPLPTDVLEAVSGAATDIGRRQTRLRFLVSICDGEGG
jgi:hypothetical protein